MYLQLCQLRDWLQRVSTIVESHRRKVTVSSRYHRCVKEPQGVIHSDPEILGGTPVFVGTRVPLQALIDYLEGGHPLSEFLDDFPTVSRDQAVAALEQAKELLLAHSAR
jgi:uncharacterized protein (DUF433 family)